MSNKTESFLSEIYEYLSEPIHKQIINAYSQDNPSDSMENELNNILLKVISNEDKLS